MRPRRSRTRINAGRRHNSRRPCTRTWSLPPLSRGRTREHLACDIGICVGRGRRVCPTAFVFSLSDDVELRKRSLPRPKFNPMMSTAQTSMTSYQDISRLRDKILSKTKWGSMLTTAHVFESSATNSTVMPANQRVIARKQAPNPPHFDLQPSPGAVQLWPSS